MENKLQEQIFIIKCIELYQSLPALWKVKSEEYTNREKKAEAYEILLNFYRKRYPTATEEDLKKKFNSLRTNFRKELRKMKDPKKSGAGTNVNKSTLWYFDAMKFLLDQETADDFINTKRGENEESLIEIFDVEDITNPQPSKKKKNPEQEGPMDEIFQLACARLRESTSDEYQLAMTWARDLQQMNSLQQIFAKKFINDILFEGRMGTLHRNSVVIKEPQSPI